uniref:Major facilitator superfamily (MFS) profile domain-containing protein n=2 Tax=Clastoptera arizonana TaxID=38151 RepID=A0A1B6E1B6_9HEMI
MAVGHYTIKDFEKMNTVTPSEAEDGTKTTQAPETSRRHLYFTVIIVNCIYFLSGESMTWTSPVLPVLTTPGTGPILLSHREASILVRISATGQVFGPILSGLLISNIGRKRTIIVMIFLFIAQCSLLFITLDAVYLYAGKFLGGMAVGMSVTSLPIYVAEISDDSVRGMLNASPLVFRSVGYLAMYAVGPFVSYFTFSIFCLVAPILVMLLFLWVPESPYYLIATGRKEKAVSHLSWLRGCSERQAQAEADKIEISVERSLKNPISIQSFFASRANLRALFLGMCLVFFRQMCGITVVLYIMETLFINANVPLSSSASTIVVGVVMVIAAVTAPPLIKKAGYKRPLIASALGMFLSLGLFGLHFYFQARDIVIKSPLYIFLPLLSLMVYIVFFSIGFANNAYALVGEMFSPNVKAVGTAATNCFGFICALLALFLYYSVYEAVGMFASFWLFSILCLMAAWFVWLFVPETKGLSLDDIQEILSRPWVSKTVD